MNESPVILVEQRDGVAQVTINRPEKRNALSAEVRHGFLSMLDALGADSSVRVVVVTGAGDKAFVAGADIKEFAERNAVDQQQVMVGRTVHEAIERFAKPVIAAINGYCLGGGLELAMACDFRIASAQSLFGQPEINLGIIPGGGGTQRLPRLVGLGMAMKMILTGEPIDAAEAHRIGLVEEVVAPQDLMPRARQLAERIAGKSPVALSAAKEATRAALHTPLSEGIRVERGLYLLAFGSEDKTEGIRAFLDKRPARFTGR